MLYFYTAPYQGLNNIIVSTLALSILTDGAFLLLHLPLRPVSHTNLSFDPNKLTIVIACYNGEDVIGNTIQGALVHVKPQQIIVVSDASTDRTGEIAREYGVQVLTNKRNLNKAFSISSVIHKVTTPYVLVLDDDTLIDKTFIPTSLLDEGYGAVAFNVMPIKTKTLINALQTFEYRKSMVMGKSLRAGMGAVGNVSGAIGLYRTADLLKQVTKHSGQYGGEDQQRTAFVHLYGEGKGVTFIDATVSTKAPDTLKQFLRQRCFRWNLSLPELCFLNLKILFTPRLPYLLKIEKAYKIYLLTTDPLRILFFWVIFTSPLKALILYLFYIVMNLAIWLKTGRKDPLWIVFIFPAYSSFRAGCRFIAHVHWFKVKYRYLFKYRFHTLVTDRKLSAEYGSVAFLLLCLWSLSGRFLADTALPVYTKYVTAINGSIRVAANSQPTAQPTPSNEIITLQSHDVSESELGDKKIQITVHKDEGITNIARKAIHDYSQAQSITLTEPQHLIAEDALRRNMNVNEPLLEGHAIEIETNLVKKYVDYALTK